MYKSLLSIIFLVLAGCDNGVVNNSGALANIDFTGTVWAGNVKNAKVQFVGVDQYGQAQRQDDGSFYGDSYYTDELGQFSAAIQGAYTGSLIAIASYDETSGTQVKCVLPSGCKKDGAGDLIEYGAWYDAPSDFEMWGAISSVTGLEQFNITPVTHLAVKQAFNQSVSDGSSCDDSDASSCLGTILKNNVLTPETIYEGNHRVKQFFLLKTGLHVNTTPWYEGFSATDSATEIESTKHGLISMALQKFETEGVESPGSIVDVLDWWVESFLEHDGSFYIAANVDDLDVTELFQAVTDIKNDYDANNKSNSALAAAAVEFTAYLNDLNAGSAIIIPFEQVVYDADTNAKIVKAMELVDKVKAWALNLEGDTGVSPDVEVQYSVFFDDDVAKEITDMEDKWALYNQKLSPAMRALFKPMIKTAEYALGCALSSGCDAGHDLSGKAVFDADGKGLFSAVNLTGLMLDGALYDYESINLSGEIDDAEEDGIYKKTFYFTDASILTSEGSTELLNSDDVKPSISFWLNSVNATNVDSSVIRIDVNVPNLKLASTTTPEYQFNTTAFNAVLIGTQDQVELIDTPSAPYHFNIFSVNIEGKFSAASGLGDAMDLRFTLNSENADTYYSPTRFPDIEMNIDSVAFKEYANLDDNGDASGFISDQGGWFTLPANIARDGSTGAIISQTLSGDKGVTFFDREGYSTWTSEYDLLKELLALSYIESASLGTLEYPGGETALVIFKSASTETSYLARQCTRVGDAWGCQSALSLSSLGCGTEFSETSSTVVEAFDWLKDNGCIDKVKIDGRGVYEIDYSGLGGSFTNDQSFPITLETPEYLGIESFYLSLISRFFDESDEARSTALMIFNGAAPDLENVTMGFSLTHDYIGGNSSSLIGVDSLIPYGDNSIWLAVGQSSTEQDALVYYIQDDSNIAMTVFGFDYADQENSVNPSHNSALAVIRYDGQLLGSLRKEGDLYVIRYIDGTWQLL